MRLAALRLMDSMIVELQFWCFHRLSNSCLVLFSLDVLVKDFIRLSWKILSNWFKWNIELQFWCFHRSGFPRFKFKPLKTFGSFSINIFANFAPGQIQSALTIPDDTISNEPNNCHIRNNVRKTAAFLYKPKFISLKLRHLIDFF